MSLPTAIEEWLESHREAENFARAASACATSSKHTVGKSAVSTWLESAAYMDTPKLYINLDRSSGLVNLSGSMAAKACCLLMPPSGDPNTSAARPMDSSQRIYPSEPVQRRGTLPR